MMSPILTIVLLMLTTLTCAVAVESKSCASMLKTVLDEIRAQQMNVNDREKTTETTEEGPVQVTAIPQPPTATWRLERRRRSAPSPQLPMGGAIYTRWGRTNCSNEDSELIYKGHAGGSHFTQTGGGSNYLCLPEHPTWNRYTDSTAGQNTAYVYGAEYEAVPNDFPFGKTNARVLFNHNVPCAVCQSKCRSSILMVPGKKECFDGWFWEYSGYLAAGFHSHKSRNEFVCMDENPEADVAGYRDEGGTLFYPVKSACGSLPCPPYVQNRELTCVVCSK